MPFAAPHERTRELLQAASGGAREALGQLFEVYRDDLIELAKRQLDPELRAKGGASDIVQETFLKAQRGFGEFHGSTPPEFEAWLRTILRNHLANFSRQFRATDKRQLGREVALDERAVNGNQVIKPTTPSAQAVQREHLELLDKAIEQLPDHYLQVVLLRHRQNLSFEEIGNLLGRSPEAARKLWERAIAQMREQFPLADDT
jgi:RNA polymerase sigma-70 factor, ECF subfamily